MVDWRTAIPLLVITTLVAPLGVWILQVIPTNIVWWIYVGVLIWLAIEEALLPELDAAVERLRQPAPVAAA